MGEGQSNLARRGLPVPARLARAGLLAVFVAVCIPGFAVAFPRLPSIGALSSGLFLAGLGLLAASVFTAITERLDRQKQPWIPVVVVAVSAVIPFVNASVSFPSDNRNWLVTHLALMSILLSAHFFSFEFIGALLRAGMIASLVTVLGGTSALSVDERSLFLLDGRLRGVFGHANMTGLVAVAAFLLALGSSRRWKRVDLVLSICVVAAATSLTSLAAAVLGLTAWFVRERMARLLVLAAGLLSLFIPAILVLNMGSKLDPALFTGRAGAWQWSLSLDFPPFTGLGTGLFDTLGAGKFVPWFHAHNQVIMDYVTGGWPLLCTTVVLLASVGFWAVGAKEHRQLAMWCVLVLQCATEVPLTFSYPSGSMLSSALILVLVIRGRDVSEKPFAPSLASNSTSSWGKLV